MFCNLNKLVTETKFHNRKERGKKKIILLKLTITTKGYFSLKFNKKFLIYISQFYDLKYYQNVLNYGYYNFIYKF